MNHGGISPAAVPRPICRGRLSPDRKPALSSFRGVGNPAVYDRRVTHSDAYSDESCRTVVWIA